MIRAVNINDAERICEIYNYYVANSAISFEENEVSVSEMKGRIQEYTKLLPWLVFEEHGNMLGYAYATQWKTRSAYRYTAETTVYLANESAGRGIGTQLYEALINQLSDFSIHRVMGVIALPNSASIALHEKVGFKKAAHFSEVGWKMGRWVDVGYWELSIENKN